MNSPDPSSPELISRRTFLKRVIGGILAVAAAGLTGGLYTNRLEPNWIELKSISLNLPRLEKPFNGFRFIQVSDLHFGDWLGAQHLQDALTTVLAKKPELVVFTGDFISIAFAHRLQELQTILTPFAAAVPCFAILGNRDNWQNGRPVRNMLAASGTTFLGNRIHTLQRGAASLHLAGLGSVISGQNYLSLVMQNLPPQGAAILLCHEPDFADQTAATGRFDLQLSGHSHGGQVQIPLVGPLVLPSYASKYPSGQYQVGTLIQYTNRGLGMVSPHVRFNCRPEITVFTLNSI